MSDTVVVASSSATAPASSGCCSGRSWTRPSSVLVLPRGASGPTVFVQLKRAERTFYAFDVLLNGSSTPATLMSSTCLAVRTRGLVSNSS
eukprot:9474073-Pyramimonas_sp.AAC.1